MHEHDKAVARLATAWLLWYPDDELMVRMPDIRAAVAELPDDARDPLSAFMDWFESTDLMAVRREYVQTFDMKRKACPYLTYWTHGDTRNRGMAILHFKQAYLDAGFDAGDAELADHLAVVLEFAAIGDRLTGDALLSEHTAAIGLLQSALESVDSPYAMVLQAVTATLPQMTPAIAERMAQIATHGPPVEQVGLEPFGLQMTGARR
ncbi:MAG: nitrate reductase molybdenum cofactor assembly chaperone [Actinobacteria bacterium]|nr:nitrate reductase molybdenum cofactor assembly chaperone [Actinomycetota bacterium]MCB8997983.1 nitrate reductase molybdenum cofactor assembly chaperone [Actinomycetota bacterium]MCB9414420.1 nitrate reductase molybdenum cofactor assembly chaperone [Actinomycetota bacterium]MCB9424705.1 nitrate reductase molybdenum cofactor assembly chaperone [Actinomycetota bacterium]HRY09392.1 nitrate reductase molybdenum cofactor assembly chaperone [Candidatus Nanopelagicales bacterium]